METNYKTYIATIATAFVLTLLGLWAFWLATVYFKQELYVPSEEIRYKAPIQEWTCEGHQCDKL